MREITIGKQEIRVRATPLALLYYRQEFNADLIGDMAKIESKNIGKDPSKFDSVTLLQITWAMARADAGIDEKFPGFISWLSNLEGLSFADPLWMKAVMEEATEGFFRGRAAPAKQKQRNSKALRS